MSTKQRYPISLFWVGFIINFFKNCLLNAVMIILLIAGIWYKPCMYAGLAILALDLILAFITQMKIKKALTASFEQPRMADETDNTSPDDIILDPNWVEDLKESVDDRSKAQNDIIIPYGDESNRD